MTPGLDAIRKRLERGAARFLIERDAVDLIAEVKRLQAVIDQHSLCHDLHGKVNAEDFAKGCEAEQRRIYGCAPHADELKRLQAKEGVK